MKLGSIPPTQDASDGMLAIAVLFKAREPDVHEFIMSLPGNPRIFQVAYGFQDHVKLIVDSGFGDKAIEAIEFYAKSITDISRVNGADIITWWA